jgi:hypothetical protein
LSYHRGLPTFPSVLSQGAFDNGLIGKLDTNNRRHHQSLSGIWSQIASFINAAFFVAYDAAVHCPDSNTAMANDEFSFLVESGLTPGHLARPQDLYGNNKKHISDSQDAMSNYNGESSLHENADRRVTTANVLILTPHNQSSSDCLAQAKIRYAEVVAKGPTIVGKYVSFIFLLFD